MQLDMETLLAPTAENQPQGKMIDYDGDFQELERTLEGRPEQQYGATVIQAQEPDWSKILKLAEQLLLKSKDFRLAIIRTRALTRISGPVGTVQGLSLVIAMIDRYWQDGYPSLAEDGGEDPLPRSNSLAPLVVNAGLLGDLRACEITSHLLGKISLGTLERIALSREGSANEQLSREQLPRFLADEFKSGNRQLVALNDVHEKVRDLQVRLSQHLDIEYRPDFSVLLSLLALLCQPAHSPTADEPGSPVLPETALQPSPPNLTEATDRQQAITMLDAVCEFLEQTEPANPAPLLIKRARNMIGADFLTILRDLAPTGLAEAERIAGVLKEN